jgi:hypothetical protein
MLDPIPPIPILVVEIPSLAAELHAEPRICDVRTVVKALDDR